MIGCVFALFILFVIIAGVFWFMMLILSMFGVFKK
jgi:hypothetical protein